MAQAIIKLKSENDHLKSITKEEYLGLSGCVDYASTRALMDPSLPAPRGTAWIAAAISARSKLSKIYSPVQELATNKTPSKSPIKP